MPPNEPKRSQEVLFRFCRSADRAFDAIEQSDPAGYELVEATLRAALAKPPRAPVLPIRSRRAHDGRALSVVQAGRYAVVLAAGPSSRTVDVVGVLLSPA
jgi:hypothetical protein